MSDVDAQRSPLRMRTATVFEGGHLQATWVPWESNMREISGRTFYAVRNADRPFARAMGLDLNRSPWQDVRVLTYFTALRNKAVDDAIARAEHGADPMAGEAEPAARARRQQRPRYERFDAIPSVVEISVPQMDGVDSHVMNVASTANYCLVLEFELNAANVEYLYKAFASSPPPDSLAGVRTPRRCRKLLPMYDDTPDVVERPRYGSDNTRLTSAFTTYTDRNGNKRRHSEAIRLTEEHEQLGTMDQKKHAVASAVQVFHDENNHEDAASQGDEVSSLRSIVQ